MASVGQWVRKLNSSWNIPRIFNQLWVMKDIKGGKLVGTDQFNNKYYEDLDETWSRQRHVEYSAYDFDPTQVPAHWRTWLHHTHGPAPAPKADVTAEHKWISVQHAENFTGTTKAYKPYSTTVSKMQEWQPVVKERL